MGLSNDLISQFVNATKPNKVENKETITYGTIVVDDSGSSYVKLDGTDRDNPILTPIETTAGVDNGERVVVMIKNHTAVVIGNLSSPSVRTEYVRVVEQQVTENTNKVAEFDVLIADKVSTEEFVAEKVRVDGLMDAFEVVTTRLTASEANIDELEADNVTIHDTLRTNNADILYLKTQVLDSDEAHITFATIEDLKAAEAEIDVLEAAQADFEKVVAGDITALSGRIDDLEADKITVTDLEASFANIDFSNITKAAIEHFYATSGLIEDVVVGDGTVTGRLVGVTISGDLIEGNTIVAEKLVIKGTDGLYYKLNTDGMKTEAEQTDQNSLNGSIIKAKSITATKISVSDLVAFGATIGGINIAAGALYTGSKASVDNTAIGVYLDKHGQMAIGDASNYLKYYTHTDGSRKLEISADTIKFGTSKKNVEAAISDVQNSVDDIKVGGRNLILHSKLDAASDKWTIGNLATSFESGYLELTKGETTSRGYYNQNNVPIPEQNREYTLSMEVMKMPDVDIPSDSSVFVRYVLDGTIIAELIARIPTTLTEGVWTKISNSFIYDDEIPSSVQATIALGKTSGGLACRHIKYEEGNKVTDWSPAPEDMATVEKVEEVAITAEDAQTRVTAAEALIEILSESISMLVTDGSGASLMTQTENGWTFSTGEMQTLIDRTSEALTDLTNEVGNVNNTVDILQQAVDDLGTIAEYVKIGTYEDEPCIELGESDSDFKLRITNTRMIFTEGSVVLAYFNNQSLHIKKAVVEEELQQGGFVWKVRSNGNMGLVWKGVTG